MDILGVGKDISQAEAAAEQATDHAAQQMSNTAKSIVDYACNKLAAMLEGAAQGLRKQD